MRQPHDRFIRWMLGHPDRARVLLRAKLSPESLAPLDLDKLRIDERSYIHPDLRELVSDVMVWIPFKDGPGSPPGSEPMGVHILIEHKSWNDFDVLVQILKYQTAAIDKEHQATGSHATVFAVIVHTGPEPWTIARTWQESLPWRLPPGLAKLVIDFGYELMDLQKESDDLLAGDAVLRDGMLLMKYLHHPAELAARLPGLLADGTAAGGLEFLERSVWYLQAAASELDPGVLRAAAEQAAPGKGSNMVGTIAERLLNQGRAEGEAKGRVEGMLFSAEQGLVAMGQARRAIEVFESRGEISHELALDALARLDRLGQA